MAAQVSADVAKITTFERAENPALFVLVALTSEAVLTILPPFSRMAALPARDFKPCWCGAVAQLGERVVRNDEVSGSIPLSSTITTFDIQI